jgi:hypothetical protein
MARLESMEGEILSKVVREVSPIRYETNKKKNKLLDGTFHVQIIGSALKYIDLIIVSSLRQVEQINLLVDKGSPFVLLHFDKRYTAHIDKELDWKRLNFSSGNVDKSYYETKATLIIKEEG